MTEKQYVQSLRAFVLSTKKSADELLNAEEELTDLLDTIERVGLSEIIARCDEMIANNPDDYRE